MTRISLALLALVLAFGAQAALRAGAPGAVPADGAILYGAAVALFLAALGGQRLPPLPVARVERDESRSNPAGRNRSRFTRLSGLALAGTGVLLGVPVALRFTGALPQPGGWPLHIASVLAFVAGSLLLDRALRPAPAGPHAPRRVTWGVVAAVAGLMGVAALLRLPRLGALPFGVWYDEAVNALAALDILGNPAYRPLYLPATFHTAHHNYLVALAFRWLGEGVAQARLVSVLMGVALVPAGYLLASELYYGWGRRTSDAAGGQTLAGRTLGLLFAGLLAVSAWAVNFSRIGVNYLATPLFAMLAVGFTLRALRRGRLADWLIAGLALGLGLNFYTSFRLFVPVLPLFVLIVLAGGVRTARTGGIRDDGGRQTASVPTVGTLWPGLLVMSLAALLVVLPLLSFASRHPDTFLKRTRETYLCANRTAAECAPLLLENTRKHLLMFNRQGDPNGRHNLPGRPMLDPVLGALFVVGLALCFWRWRRPTSWLLLLWLGFGLLGGILTLDFESPQSLRSNAAIPAAYLIAFLPLGELLHAWGRSEGGRYYPRLAPAVAALAFLPLAVWHANAYFAEQARDFASWNAFSAAETITAHTLSSLDPNETAAYVVGYYYDQPTLRWLAPRWTGAAQRLDTAARLPLAWPPGKDVWLFLDPDSRGLFDQLQHLYPGGEFAVQGPPFSDNVSLFTAHLTPDAIASVRGLTARYYPNEDWSGDPAIIRPEPQIAATWQPGAPLPAPFSAEWEGILRVDEYGLYGFSLAAPAPSARAQLMIDETPVLSGTGNLSATVMLAKGNHALRTRVSGAPAEGGRVELAWQPPGGSLVPIPGDSLYRHPVTANGLLGRYYPNADWQPPAALEQVDPHLFVNYHETPLARPYTAEWTGKIFIPAAGEYLFGIESVGEAELFMDGEPVAAVRWPELHGEGRNVLTAGLHDIRVRFRDTLDHSRLHLYWTPPGGARTPLPSTVLFPPLGRYDHLDLDALAVRLAGAPAPSFGGIAVPPAAPSGDATPAPFAAQPTVAQTGLRDPAGIAAGPDGRIYVADTGNARLLILHGDGTLERMVSAGSRPLLEPFDVATGPDGSVYVLDAGTAVIEVFDAAGTFLRAIGPLPEVIGRARGLDVDDQGRIGVAHTPGGRLVALSGAGDVLQEIPAWPGGDAQVTDVAVAPDGSIYAAVLGVNKLVQFDAMGAQQMVWDLRPANTIDSPHLDVDANGNVYLTEPEESRVALISPQGERAGHWQLPTSPAMFKPVGVAVDPRGRVWVTDAEGGRVAWVE